MSNTIAENISQLRQKIDMAAIAAGRTADSVSLVAVSKASAADRVALAIEAGQRMFGESYAQEAVDKIQTLRQRFGPQVPLVWHYIGPLQKNKTRLIANEFDWVQAIDRTLIADRLNDQRDAHLPPLQVCVQVNIDDEPQKHGCGSAGVLALCQHICQLPKLKLRGLMAIPAIAGSHHQNSQQANAFARMRQLFDALNQSGLALDTLSMGMSDDWQNAVAEGSTMVRIGSAIFGNRKNLCKNSR